MELSDPEPIDKSALYFEHRRSLWEHHDLPLSLKTKLFARSPSGAIPSPTFLSARASRNTASINGAASLMITVRSGQSNQCCPRTGAGLSPNGRLEILFLMPLKRPDREDSKFLRDWGYSKSPNGPLKSTSGHFTFFTNLPNRISPYSLQ